MFVCNLPSSRSAPLISQNYSFLSKPVLEPLSGPRTFRCIVPCVLRLASGPGYEDEPQSVALWENITSFVAGYRGADIRFSLAKQLARGITSFFLCLQNETDIKITTQWTLGFYDPYSGAPLQKSKPVNTNFEKKGGKFCFGAMDRDINIGLECQMFSQNEVIQNGFVFDGKLHVYADIFFQIESGGMEPRTAPSGGLLMNALQRELEDPVFSDFTIVSSDGQQIKTHKLILRLASPVFRRMFETECQETRSSTCKIKDADAVSIRAFLTYLHKDLLGEPPFEVTKTLFALADKYEVGPLKKLCARKLWEMINLETVSEILRVADLHHEPRLKNEAFIFIEDNLEEIIMNGGLYELAGMDKVLYEEWQLHFFARRNDLPKYHSLKVDKLDEQDYNYLFQIWVSVDSGFDVKRS